MHRNVRRLFREYALPYLAPDARVLEIGPDLHPSTLQGLVDHPVAAWDTLDFASRTDVPLTYRTTAEYTYPVADAAYDVIVSASVIEHVRKIWTWMGELARICRPGGHVITIGPVSWNYHESPIDCWRIYPEGMRALSDEAGLEVVLSEWGSTELRKLESMSPRKLRDKHFWQRLSGAFGLWHAVTRLPPEGAYDTITVARKPVRE
jgi:SAM-dependent methyltransferase